MDYFNDLQFIRAANLPHRKSFHQTAAFDYYTIHYCHAGNFFLKINDEPLITSTGPCAFLTFPGADFTYGNPDTGYHHLYASFRGELAEQWQRGGLLRCLKKDALILIHNQAEFFNKFEKLVSLLHGPERTRNHARATVLLSDLLLQMTEQQQLYFRRRNPFTPKMNDLTKALHRNPELEWDFSKEARKMKISYSYFRKLFEELYLEPPHHYLLQCRLQKAEQLLISSDLQIKETAVLCGFTDEFYFSRLFKKYYGTSPLKYRKEYLPIS